MNLADTKLLGKNAIEYAEVIRWLSFANLEVLPTAATIIMLLKGISPYNKKLVDEKSAYLEKLVAIFEARLSKYTYLVGERVSFADYFCAFEFVRLFENLFGTEWRKAHPATARWFKTVAAQPLVKNSVSFEYATKPLEYVPPKKEKKEKEPKKEAKKEVKKEVKEEQPAEAPKPKHPLSLLPASKVALDEWKRVYSNEDTREKAIPWFWKNMYDPAEWSLWKVDYKYNDELTMTFMSNNLVGGFFNRLSASLKYMFGCLVVYGENNNNGITGFFLVRGQEIEPAVDVAPDYESYAFEKLDGSSEATRKFVDNMLAWDEPVDVKGEKREIADGKVLK